jgi:hypothetical protein
MQDRQGDGTMMKIETNSHVFIAHGNGEIYEGVVKWQNADVIHLEASTGKKFIIMKMDIRSSS